MHAWHATPHSESFVLCGLLMHLRFIVCCCCCHPAQGPVVQVSKTLVGANPKTVGQEFSWTLTPRITSGSATSVFLVDYIDPASGIDFVSVKPSKGALVKTYMHSITFAMNCSLTHSQRMPQQMQACGIISTTCNCLFVCISFALQTARCCQQRWCASCQ